MKKQLMERNRAMWLALMAAAFNYATDILFLVKELLPDVFHEFPQMYLVFNAGC